MSITGLKEAIAALAQSLQVSTIFPASLLVLCNIYWILPYFRDVSDQSSYSSVTFIVSTSLVLSYGLYAYNFPIIRLMEGYKISNFRISVHLRNVQQTRMKGVRREIERREEQLRIILLENGMLSGEDIAQLRLEDRDRWDEIDSELSQLYRILDVQYPLLPKTILATRLGNTIRAFEEYPGTRYGIDTIALWPRLVPVLKEQNFLPFVVQEKAVFDFLLNMFVIVGIIGFELFYIPLFFGDPGIAIASLLMTPCAMWCLYEGMIIAARQWGMTVRVAFDMHRGPLLTSLGLNPQESFEQDKLMWQEVSKFYLFPDHDSAATYFKSTKEIANNGPSKKKAKNEG